MQAVNQEYFDKYQSVYYHGLTIEVPIWTKCIATDKNGEIFAFETSNIYPDTMLSDKWYPQDYSYKSEFVRRLESKKIDGWLESKLVLEDLEEEDWGL